MEWNEAHIWKLVVSILVRSSRIAERHKIFQDKHKDTTWKLQTNGIIKLATYNMKYNFNKNADVTGKDWQKMFENCISNLNLPIMQLPTIPLLPEM